MRMSELFAPTLRDDPHEAEIPSHRLMLRAGYLRKVAAGMYTLLPLGFRVLQKVSAIIREEMDRQGSQELLLPIIQPAELWTKTGRWDEYGELMFRLKDRVGRSFCLGPTHEEIITALVAAEVNSYRQLPLRLYQIQNKYRDELRPRFGVMRGREFLMKDLYSFDRDEAGLDESYRRMFTAYVRAFARCGLDVRAVEADPGAIGGSVNHEFMVLADTGEDEIVSCLSCSYAANVEKAECPPPSERDRDPGETPPVEAVSTPGARTVEEVTAFLGRPARELLKTILYVADGKPVAAIVRGDHQVNEVKLRRALGARELETAPPALIRELTGAEVGFAGPVGLSPEARIVADPWAVAVADAVTGANKTDTHLVHVVYGRDWQAHAVCDIRTAVAGDPCPRCGETLTVRRGIEVGHLFKLGTKYSEALGATFLDEDGERRPIIMGCYGIGVSRTLAAIIEQHHDEAGIRWPVTVAPYHVVVVPVKYEDDEQREAADNLYQSLLSLGVEAVLDDRPERAGVKFKDADLIGFPLRVTVGPKGLAEGAVEFSWRAEDKRELVSLEEAAARARDELRARIAEIEARAERLSQSASVQWAASGRS